jgi:hypothetical protein
LKGPRRSPRQVLRPFRLPRVPLSSSLLEGINFCKYRSAEGRAQGDEQRPLGPEQHPHERDRRPHLQCRRLHGDHANAVEAAQRSRQELATRVQGPRPPGVSHQDRHGEGRPTVQGEHLRHPDAERCAAPSLPPALQPPTGLPHSPRCRSNPR